MVGDPSTSAYLQLADEDRDLHCDLLVALHHHVVGEGGAVDPVDHQHVHILNPEQCLGQVLRPGWRTAQGPVGWQQEDPVQWRQCRFIVVLELMLWPFFSSSSARLWLCLLTANADTFSRGTKICLHIIKLIINVRALSI